MTFHFDPGYTPTSVNDPPKPDMDEYARMGLAIQRGEPFEKAVERGVRDTPQHREAFERLKVELADMEKRGITPEWSFE